MEEVRKIVAAHRAALLRLPNVVGVGVGERAGQTVVKVLVSRKVSSADLKPDELVPKTVGSYPCDVEEVGVVQAQAVQAQGLK